MTHRTDTHSDLRIQLDRIGHRIAELGTNAEIDRLAALADAVRHVAPGAAAALVDPDGSEISRLRAFAVAGAALLRLPATDEASTPVAEPAAIRAAA